MADEGGDARPAPTIRVGDVERRAVDEQLQRAHGEGRLTLTEYEERTATVWTARTQADLDALTADLPPSPPAAPSTLPVAGTTDQPVAADREAGVAPWVRRAGGVLGALVLAGAALWGGTQVVSQADGVAVFSARDIAVAADDDRVELGMLFGSADIVVPDDARVVQTGTTLFAGGDCDAACSGTGTREITVDVSGAFAGVDILTQSEAAAEAAERAAEDAAEEAEDAAEDDD